MTSRRNSLRSVWILNKIMKMISLTQPKVKWKKCDNKKSTKKRLSSKQKPLLKVKVLPAELVRVQRRLPAPRRRRRSKLKILLNQGRLVSVRVRSFLSRELRWMIRSFATGRSRNKWMSSGRSTGKIKERCRLESNESRLLKKWTWKRTRSTSGSGRSSTSSKTNRRWKKIDILVIWRMSRSLRYSSVRLWNSTARRCNYQAGMAQVESLLRMKYWLPLRFIARQIKRKRSTKRWPRSLALILIKPPIWS